METETKILTGLAGLIALYNIKPIAKTVAKGFKWYMHQAQEVYKGYGIAAQLTPRPFMEIEYETKPKFNTNYKQTRQNFRMP